MLSASRELGRRPSALWGKQWFGEVLRRDNQGNCNSWAHTEAAIRGAGERVCVPCKAEGRLRVLAETRSHGGLSAKQCFSALDTSTRMLNSSPLRKLCAGFKNTRDGPEVTAEERQQILPFRGDLRMPHRQ